MVKVNQGHHLQKPQGMGIQPLGTSSGSILKLLLLPSFCTSSRKIPFASLFYTPGIYAEGYIVFVFLFVCWFVRSFVLPSCLWNYFKVLRASNSSGVYLTNHSSESIHIWTMGTLKGRLSFHGTPGYMPRGGARGKNLGHL